MASLKKRKLAYAGAFPKFDPEDNLFQSLLCKHFEIEHVTQNPDFVICQTFGTPFEYANFDCPRIFYSGENFSANFNSFDYTITYDDLSYGDRHFSAPYFLFDRYCQKAFSDCKLLFSDNKEVLLAGKDKFCNFIFAHDSCQNMRSAVFNKLNEYRRVDSPGILYNNMENGMTIPYSADGQEKMDFISKCKFSIAIESLCQPGFTTEKIIHAWLAHTIPIYWGNPEMDKIFNPHAYLDVRNFASLDDLLAEVKRLDQDDDAWYAMVSQPLFLEENYFQHRMQKLEEFLVHIFDQDPAEAYRRSKDFLPSEHDARLRDYNHFLKSRTYKHYLKEKRWNQRRYWATYHLHHLAPSLIHEPNKDLLR